MRVRVGVLHARVRAEERALMSALDGEGLTVVPLHVPGLTLDPGAPPDVDVVVDRCLGLTQGLAALRVFEAAGVPCVNRPSVTARCGDKLATQVALEAAGVPVARARVAFSVESAVRAVEELGYPAVIKPVVGSWGRLLARVHDRDAAEAVAEHKLTLGGFPHSVVFVQEHVDKPGRDLRSFVIGDRTVCAIARSSGHWITNTSRGGVVEAVPVDAELDRVSRAAAHAVGGGALAVDLFETDDGLIVNEVNATMEFRNSSTPTGVDIASELARWVVGRAVDRSDARPDDRSGEQLGESWSGESRDAGTRAAAGVEVPS